MVRPYIHLICPSAIVNICRLAGVLPISWSCNDQGLPVFSCALFCYSLSLSTTAFLLHFAAVCTSDNYIVEVTTDFVFRLMIGTLIIIPCNIQCKRGLMKQMILNMKQCDEVMKYSEHGYRWFAICLIGLLLSVQLTIYETQDHYTWQSIYSVIYFFNNFANEVLIVCTISSLSKRLKILNKSIENKFNNKSAMSLATVSHRLEPDMPIPVFNKLHFLMGETIFLANTYFGIQFLATFIWPISTYMYNYLFGVLDVSVEVLKYVSDVHWLLFSTISIFRFIIVVWICTEVCEEAKNTLLVLTKIKKRKLNRIVRKQLKTMQLQQPYRCTELSAAGIFPMDLPTIYSVFAVTFVNSIIDQWKLGED